MSSDGARVWIVMLIDWETRVVAVYDNESSAREHAATRLDLSVDVAVVKSRFEKSDA